MSLYVTIWCQACYPGVEYWLPFFLFTFSFANKKVKCNLNNICNMYVIVQFKLIVMLLNPHKYYWGYQANVLIAVQCLLSVCVPVGVCVYLLVCVCRCRLTSRAGTICSMWRGSQMFTCSSSSTVFLTTPCRPRIPDTRILNTHTHTLNLSTKMHRPVVFKSKSGMQFTEYKSWYESWDNIGNTQRHWLVLDVEVFVFRVTHLTEARHKEVVAAMVRRRVLLDVRKLHKLHKTKWRQSSVIFMCQQLNIIIYIIYSPPCRWRVRWIS